MVDTD